MSNQRTGIAYIRLDGVLYETMPGAKLTDPAGIARDPVVGSAVFGFSQKVVVPTVDCEFAHGAGVSLEEIAAMDDVTVTFECDSGPVYILNNAWYASGMSLTAGDAKFGCTFQGKTCQEQLA